MFASYISCQNERTTILNSKKNDDNILCAAKVEAKF